MEITEELCNALLSAHFFEHALVICLSVRIGDERIFRPRDEKELTSVRPEGGKVGLGSVELPLIGPEDFGKLLGRDAEIVAVLAEAPALEKAQKRLLALFQIGNDEGGGLAAEGRRKKERLPRLRIEGRMVQLL